VLDGLLTSLGRDKTGASDGQSRPRSRAVGSRSWAASRPKHAQVGGEQEPVRARASALTGAGASGDARRANGDRRTQGREPNPWRVPLADVWLDGELLTAAEQAIASGWWSMGPRVEEFEQAFARFSDAAHAIAVSSGTAALQLALLGCGCGSGDEVILPSLNFVAAANAVVHTGATPVFCDISSSRDLNLDPADLEAAVTQQSRAILVLHYGGYSCDMDAVMAIADRRGLVVIEDAAHAPGARWRDRMCGTIGRVGCFSFFSNKNLPLGEGGMIVTDDSKLAERIRLLRSHGMTTLTWDRHRGHAHTYDVLTPGFNYRLDELRAAVGLVQLSRLEAGNAARAVIVGRYRRILDGVTGLTVAFADRHDTSAHHLAVVVLPEGIDRERIQELMRQRGIQTSVHYPPIHRFSAYADSVGSRRPLPVTESVAPRVLTLPLYPHLDATHVESVAATLLSAVASEQARGRRFLGGASVGGASTLQERSYAPMSGPAPSGRAAPA
jgi:dTDP-4-amino-4,6-dideoxygalactose transaminase